ncbi:MAG: hypothetical protein WAK55_24500 [Xanthobacteraceae bacterium]
MSRQRYRRLCRLTFSARLSIAFLAAFLAAPLTGVVAASDVNGIPIPCEDIDSLGMAKMSADGTIALRIRSLWYQPVAEHSFVYAPGDPQYDAIKRHLGGIMPGQSKPVPPLCGMNSEP